MISTYQYKSRFQALLRPLAGWLHRKGVTANQVTVGTCGISLALGGLALALAASPYRFCFLLIAFWCFLRMAANALDGMLAREFGQASSLGAVLNELGDVISDVALYVPFAFIAGTQQWLVAAVVVLAILSEFAGVLGAAMGGARSYDGPMGKSDRALVFGVVGLAAGSGAPVAEFVNWIWAVTSLLLALTIVNRAHSAVVNRHRGNTN